MLDREEDKIILRSEEVNEVLTSTPKWILRWGISVVLILILIGLGLCYFIRYPDVLEADITLTRLAPPAIITSKINGNIQEQQFIGRCMFPMLNAEKLRVGQNVNIKLDSYPHNENGILQGVVKNISEVPDKDTYVVDVYLKNGLTTSYRKVLPYKEEMKGKANIIIQNLSIIDRMFSISSKR